MIRIDMLRQDTRHPDKHRRHAGRASCHVAGRRFEAQGPAPVYRPGGLAMRGKVRNWARLVSGKLSFDKDAPSNPDFTPVERDMVARAAGTTPSRPGNGRTAAISPPDGSEHPQGQDDASAGIVGPQTPVAA